MKFQPWEQLVLHNKLYIYIVIQKMSWIYIKETHFPQKFPNCLIEKMKKNDPQKISISHPIFYTCLGREKLMATHTIILKSSQSTWVLGQMQFLQTFGHLHHISWLNRIYVHPSCSKKKISQFAKNLAQFSKTSPICYTSFHLKKNISVNLSCLANKKFMVHKEPCWKL